VQENYLQAIKDGADKRTIDSLADAYYDIRQGIGFNKSPAEYGAFPTDPYSHTPAGAGARQPGMTGQVKEEILTRLGELGVSVEEGALRFAPSLLRAEEFLPEPGVFAYWDVEGRRKEMTIPAGSLAFTYCQIPVVYTLADTEAIEVRFSDGRSLEVPGTKLDVPTSRHILDRDGEVQEVRVTVSIEQLLKELG
jgi:hypothetical protein